MSRIIIHSDLNNFFASVECLKKPWLKDVPMAVAGDLEQRHGIILAKNIHAARCGVKTAEPIWSAMQKCPKLITVPPNHDDYIVISRQVRKIYESYCDRVESFGIDECWLDVSDIAKDFEEGRRIADEIRERILSEINITASCGVSFNKIFAKLGSDLKKPNATSVITDTDFKDIVWRLPAENLLFVGRSTKKAFEKLNISTIGEVAATDVKTLEFLLGKNGSELWRAANGLDNSPVMRTDFRSTIKSVGNSTTTPHDLVTEDDVRLVLLSLCDSVSSRLRRLGLVCETVQLHVRDSNLRSFERQQRLPFPNRTASSLFQAAFSLYMDNHIIDTPTRSIGVRALNLSCDTERQLAVSDTLPDIQRKERLDTATDAIRKQFGKTALFRGVMLSDSELTKNAIDEESTSFVK